MSHPRRWSRRAAIALLACVALASCAGDDETSGPVPERQPAEILRSASETLAGTSAVRFELDVDGETFIDDGGSIQLLEAKGDLVRPDRVRTDFKIKILRGVTLSTSLVIVGDQRWSTDLITGEWGPPPPEYSYDPTILFDNQGGIGPVMDRVQAPTRGADQVIRGASCYHIKATVAPEVIFDLTAGTMTGAPIDVDLWIDRASSDLLRATLAEGATSDGRDPATWQLDLADHGADITIESPA